MAMGLPLRIEKQTNITKMVIRHALRDWEETGMTKTSREETGPDPVSGHGKKRS